MAGAASATGETFWQFRQYQPGDAGDPHRLAREREVAAPLCARDRMGGGAERLSVARRLGLDGLCLDARRCRPSASRADLLTLALAVLLVRGGERVTLLGTGLPPSHGRAVLDRTRAASIARAADGGASLPGIRAAAAPRPCRADRRSAGAARRAARAGRPLCRERAQGPSAAGARSGGRDAALRRPRALRRAWSARIRC